MTLDAHWPKKKGRPLSEETVAERKDRLRYYAEQRRRRQLEEDEPLNDFDIAAKIEGLWRRK